MKTTYLTTALGLASAYGIYSYIKKITEYRLEGKTVLITGGSRGLGYVLAKLCAEEKCNVVICSRNEEELRNAKESLEGRYTKVTSIRCDVTKREEVVNMIKQVNFLFEGVDVLINNAGIIQVGPFENMTVKDFEDAMNIHFWAPLFTTMEVFPEMKKKGSGRIINISSIGGKISVPHLLPYTASKFALTGFSNGLRTELKRYGIKVTTINPGLIRTGSARNLIAKGQFEKEFAGFSTTSVMPVITVSAEYAAKRILRAIKAGESEVIISLPAKIIAFLQFFFPGIVTNLFALINRLLPYPTDSYASETGSDVHSEFTPAFAKSRMEKYEKMYNQPGKIRS
jgi:short-subunit dehydrogenase